MSSKECEKQLNELLEAWDLDEATLNQTDIEAIKHLLLENQMQQDVIISYKTTNLDQAVDIQQLEQKNQQLKDKINTYENPEDLTLMFMYCDEKAKDKIKQLKEKRDLAVQKANEEREKNVDLEIELDKYKEVIEEVKTEISSLMSKYFYEKDFCIEDIHLDKLLQILDKVKGE